MKNKLLILSLSFYLLSVSMIIAEMNAEKVIENMIASYERQMEKIDDVTIISNRERTYQKRAVIDGRTVYKTRTEIIMGSDVIFTSIYDGEYNWFVNPLTGELEKEKSEYAPKHVLTILPTEAIEYLGMDDLNGHQTHLLAVQNLDIDLDLDLEGMNRGLVWIDAENWNIRKVEMEVEREEEPGEKRKIKAAITNEDFRLVDGMSIPYLTRIDIDDLALDLSPEEQAYMQQRFDEMREELANMTGPEKEMAEAMMKPVLESLQELLGGQEELMTTRVQEVRVNTALSDELFDVNKLK